MKGIQTFRLLQISSATFLPNITEIAQHLTYL